MNGATVGIITPSESCREAALRFSAGKIREGYESAGLHRWRNADGTVRFFRMRLKHPESGNKWLRPFHLNAEGTYVMGEPKAPETGKLLYNLPALIAADADKPVYIFEGEGCADSSHGLGITSTTSGGATSAAAANWEPLRGQKCIVWRDNDQSGMEYARAVIAKLRGIAAEVSLVADEVVKSLPKGGDIIDWLEAHPNATAADIRALPTEAPTSCGAVILNETYQFIGRFVAYPSEHAHVAHTLWIAHAHLMEKWDSTPRIAFLSPEPGSGKSRALEVTEPLVPSPVNAVNVSPAYIFRKIGADEGAPTLLYDEIDTVFGPKAKENEEIRGLLNAGHRKGACAGRCVVRGKEVFTEEIPAYCAVALAGLGGLPDTILSRSIVIKMRRRSPSEQVEPYRRRINCPQGERIGQKLSAWAAGVDGVIEWPDMPKGIEDRDADLWESLLAIADIVGSDWPRRAREAALLLVSESKQSTPSLGVQLLSDLRGVFKDFPVMATETILEELHALAEAPWADLRGKPLNARGLSVRLRNYGIKPKTVRIGTSTPKGYAREDIYDAWGRYLPPLPDLSATSATSATISSSLTPNVADVADVADLQEANLQPHNLEPAETRAVTGGCTVARPKEGVYRGESVEESDARVERISSLFDGVDIQADGGQQESAAAYRAVSQGGEPWSNQL